MFVACTRSLQDIVVFCTVREELLTSLPGISHNFISYERYTYKFQPGGPNYELTVGLLGLKDYFEQLGGGESMREIVMNDFQVIQEQETKITQLLLSNTLKIKKTFN